MREFRSNFTRLQQQMEDKLPDNNAFWGYSGISKEKLLSAMNLTHTLSQSIEERDDETRSEVLALKRLGNEAYRILAEYLENDFQEKTSDDGFNEFLSTLSSLIERTKLTYSSVTKKWTARRNHVTERHLIR